MPITIKELLASDTISQAADKVNFNFDQLLLNGGGPVGPFGPIGPPGPIGGRGIRGSWWYEDPSGAAGTPGDPGENPNDIPTLLPNAITNDNYLQADGEVWEYNGSVWIDTGVNLQGIQGIAGTSEDWRTFGAPPTLNGGVNVLTPVLPSTVPSILFPVDNDIFPLSIGGMPMSISSFGNGYDIETTLAQDFTSGSGVNGASLYIHVPGAPDHTNAIKFSGANSLSPDDYCIIEEQLASIGLDIGDRLVVQDSQKAPVSLANIYGLELKTFNKNMFLNIGKGLDLRTGQTTMATLPAQTSEIKLWITKTTPTQVGESQIILLNEETGPGDIRAEFKVGTTDGIVTSTASANIYGYSLGTYFNVDDRFVVTSNTGSATNCISLTSPNGGGQFDVGRTLDLRGNTSINMESASGGLVGTFATDLVINTNTGVQFVNQANPMQLLNMMGPIQISAFTNSLSLFAETNLSIITGAGDISISSADDLIIAVADIMTVTTGSDILILGGNDMDIIATQKLELTSFNNEIRFYTTGGDKDIMALPGFTHSFSIGMIPTIDTPGNSKLSIGGLIGQANAAIGRNIATSTNNTSNSLWVQDLISVSDSGIPPNPARKIQVIAASTLLEEGVIVTHGDGVQATNGFSCFRAEVLPTVGAINVDRSGFSATLEQETTGNLFGLGPINVHNTSISGSTFQLYANTNPFCVGLANWGIFSINSQANYISTGLNASNLPGGCLSVNNTAPAKNPVPWEVTFPGSAATPYNPQSGLVVRNSGMPGSIVDHDYMKIQSLLGNVAGSHYRGLITTIDFANTTSPADPNDWQRYGVTQQESIDDQWGAWVSYGGTKGGNDNEGYPAIAWGTGISYSAAHNGIGRKMWLDAWGTLNLSGGTSNSTLHLPQQAFTAGLSHHVCVEASKKIVFTGVLLSSGTISDERKKKNVKHYDYDGEILKLEPVTFDWIEPKGMFPGSGLGLIAQDVEKIIPDAVFEDVIEETDDILPGEGGFRQMKWGAITTALIAEAQEKDKKIKELENRLKLIEEKLGL